MSQPLVCSVMVTAYRPALAKRAIDCFRAQTYPNKQILILENGDATHRPLQTDGVCQENRGRTVGELRNDAIALTLKSHAEIIMHWDDDDWSHPERIAEQVALLQSSGADAVGYREMLFWREHGAPGNQINGTGEAWIYRQTNPLYALGTSLCYWRRTWERMPFPAKSRGEDLVWFDGGMNQIGVSSIGGDWSEGRCPRMVARIHAGNTSNAYRPDLMRDTAEWKRDARWDKHCAEVMEP